MLVVRLGDFDRRSDLFDRLREQFGRLFDQIAPFRSQTVQNAVGPTRQAVLQVPQRNQPSVQRCETTVGNSRNLVDPQVPPAVGIVVRLFR